MKASFMDERERQIQAAKAALRQAMRCELQQIDATSREKAAIDLAQQVAQFCPPKALKTVAAFVGTRLEIDTRPALKALLALNLQVALPVCLDQQTMRFVRYRGETLVLDAMKMLAPDPTGLEIDLSICEAIFLPGLAFNAKGQRLGMGGGFYDRALAQFNDRNRPLLIGVGFAQQLIADAIPVASWDCEVDWVVTPQGALCMASG